MRSRPALRSNQRTHSVAQPTPLIGGIEQAPAKDRREKTFDVGRQGRAICANPKCGIELTLRKVTYNNPSRYSDVPIGELVAASHREGGGQYSARRGDALCPGAAMPALPLPVPEEEE